MAETFEPIDPRILGEPFGRTSTGVEIYESEDSDEVIYGPSRTLPRSEVLKALDEQYRLAKSYRDERRRGRQRVESRRLSALVQQLRLPDIYVGPIPDRTVQLRMFSETAMRELREVVKSKTKSRAKSTGRTTPTGIPMFPPDNAWDAINGKNGA